MKRSFGRLQLGPLAALLGLIALGVWAVASELPPARDDDPLLAQRYPLDFGRQIDLKPMPGHSDEAIVEAFIRRRDDPDPFVDWSDEEIEQYDRSRIHVGRFRVQPGGETQIVVALADSEYCTWFFGCRAGVLFKTAESWEILTSFYATSGVVFTVATRPFWARPSLDFGTGGSGELQFGSRILVRPVNRGRPTFVGPTWAVFWDGTDWKVGCWQLCELR